MKVKVKFFAMAREIIGTPEQEVELAIGSNVSDLLELLINKNGEKFRNFLIDPKTDKPRPNLQFLVGDQLLVSLNGFATVLPEGVVFAIIPPVGGG